jgi:putative acetyltransferase
MNIRRYRIGEEKEIWKVCYDTTRIINGRDYTQEQVQRWAPDSIDSDWNERLRQKNPFIAEHDGQIVGFAELDANGHIDRFYSHHQWQRKGVGKLLYQAIEDEASRMKIDLLFAEVSMTAREFFLSRGFEIVGEENNLICGTIAKRFRMQKRLNFEANPN